MIQNFDPENVDNDYIHQDDRYINPEYSRQAELEMIKAIKDKKEKERLIKEGTDLYYELKTQPEPARPLPLPELDIWDMLGK